MDCNKRAGTGDDCGENSAAVTWDVNCYKNCSWQISGKAGYEFSNCISSPGGRTNHDYVASRHAGMDARLNVFTVTGGLSF